MADRKDLKTVRRGRPKKENCANEVCWVCEINLWVNYRSSTAKYLVNLSSRLLISYPDLTLSLEISSDRVRSRYEIISLLHRTFTCLLTWIKLITLSSSAHQNFTNRRKLLGAVSASRQVDKRRVFQGMNDIQRETILYFICPFILFICELTSFIYYH